MSVSNWFRLVGDRFSTRRAVRPRRRLAGEQLERRCVLSLAPLADAGDEPSLAEYSAQVHEMGPVAPPAAEVDQYFAEAATDDGMENDGDAGDGSAGTGTALVEMEIGEGEGSSSGGGSGQSSAGGGGAPENEAPTINYMDVVEFETYILIWGELSDDQANWNLPVTFSGLVSGQTTANEFGVFELQVNRPTESGDIIAVATDSGGLRSNEYWYFYVA